MRLRKLRGQLLHRPMTGPITVVADGRADRIGWLELETVAVNEVATANTARVIQHLNADILTVIEAESRPTLGRFSASMLPAVGYAVYQQVMLVEGNDTRGIDVGFMARDDVTLLEIRTHVFDTDRTGQIFSRDCCEYHVRVGTGPRIVLLVNHFKSKGYSEKRPRAPGSDAAKPAASPRSTAVCSPKASSTSLLWGTSTTTRRVPP